MAHFDANREHCRQSYSYITFLHVRRTIRGSPLSMGGRLCLEDAQTGHLYRGWQHDSPWIELP